MAVVVGSMLDVSAMGEQAQDVFTSATEAFKPETHLAFRLVMLHRSQYMH